MKLGRLCAPAEHQGSSGQSKKKYVMEFAQFIPSLEVSLQETVTQKEKLHVVEENTLQNIVRRSEEIHESVEKVKLRLQNEVKTLIQEEINRLELHEKELTRWIIWLKSEIPTENNAGKVREHENERENSPLNNTRKDNVLTTLHSLTQFEHTLIQFKAETGNGFLDEHFGTIDNYTVTLPDFKYSGPLKEISLISPKLVAQFQCSEKGNIHAIAPMSNSKAWICSGWGNRTIALYTSEGKRKMSMALNMPVDHMILTSKGDVLISGYKEKIVKRLDEQLKLSTFAELPFIPRGMTVTDTGEVFICGLKRNSNHESTDGDEDREDRSHIVAKFSSQGEFLSEIVISPRDPHRISMTPDGKLCVSFLGRNNKRQLMIMDQQGNPEKIYTGSRPEEDHTFYPLGTVCDRYGHIIVTDWNNDCVHLLDKCGTFMQYLFTEKDEFSSPSALALDRAGNVWVGNAVGCIRIYEYIS